MTPKEKATELVEKFIKMHFIAGGIGITKKQAKQCALIYANGIIDFIELCGNNFNWCYTSERIREPLEYWQEVKKEIKKL